MSNHTHQTTNHANLPSNPKKGRILRLKSGYNPNSSSIGSIVFVMPAALLAIATAFGTVASLIFAAFLGGDNANENHRSAEKEVPLQESDVSPAQVQEETDN